MEHHIDHLADLASGDKLAADIADCTLPSNVLWPERTLSSFCKSGLVIHYALTGMEPHEVWLVLLGEGSVCLS